MGGASVSVDVFSAGFDPFVTSMELAIGVESSEVAGVGGCGSAREMLKGKWSEPGGKSRASTLLTRVCRSVLQIQ